MERRDYLLREISKISILLKAILGKMINRETDQTVKVEAGFSETKDLLLDEGNLDLEKLMATDKSEFVSFFNEEAGYNAENLEYLADILVALSEQDNTQFASKLQQKALDIYEYIDETEKTFSFERALKIQQCKKYADLLFKSHLGKSV